jgi:hypothetical protein
MKRAWPVLLGLLLLGATASAQAQYTYFTNADNTLTITGYTGSGGALTIPSNIDGVIVTRIGDFAFDGSGLTDVILPVGVTNIGQAAFGNTPSLTNITIPNSVTSIGEAAFSGSGLASMILPDSIAEIETNIFENCTNLTSVTVPGSVTNICDHAFSSCSGLTNITIPGSVTSIGTATFSFCSSLTNVTIPGSVTSIGYGAFSGCSGLTNVTISSGVTSIGFDAFVDCSSLTRVNIPSSVTNIGQYAFSGCSSLTAITVDPANPLYSSVSGVLFNNTQATIVGYPGGLSGSYTIPSGVTTIGVTAFSSCDGLTSVTIPTGVITIEDYAFSSCSGLTNVTISDGVTSIDTYAFAYCSNLTSVTIPSSVTHTEVSLFESCTHLTSVFVTGNADTNANWFYGDTNVTVYYLPGTSGWSSTFSGFPTMLWNPLIQTADGSFGISSNQFGFNITSTNNLPVLVEACSNLAHPIWIPVTNIFLTNGLFHFTEPLQSTSASRFYGLGFP